MGRGKLHMELIRKEKSRNTTFKKRKEGLMRKIHEFTTLCDVSACMIIYGPKQEAGAAQPEIWPENQEEVRELIGIYRNKSKDSGSCRTYGLGDFFDDRKRRMEDELEKLRKKNMESKFPTWLDFLSLFSEMQLRSLAGGLSHKLEVVKNRIESMKESEDHHQQEQNQYSNEGSRHDMPMMMSRQHVNFNPGLIQRGRELDLMNQQVISGVNPIELRVPVHYPAMDHQEHQMHPINQNPMMMMLMNDNDDHQHHQYQLQVGGGSHGSNIQPVAFKRQVFFESTAGVLDNMAYNNAMYANPRPLSRYYAPSLQPLQQPYVRCPAVRPNTPPLSQLHSSQDNNEIADYQMRDQKARQ